MSSNSDLVKREKLVRFDAYLHECTSNIYVATPAVTADGVQDSDARDTTTANVDITVFQATIEGEIGKALKGLYFNLEAMLRAVSTATADLIWKWQARNKDGTWVDLHAAVTDLNIGIVALSRVRKGFSRPQTNLNTFPIDVRLILQCNEANEGRGQVRNTSFVTVSVVGV